jgi:hypothetical protein
MDLLEKRLEELEKRQDNQKRPEEKTDEGIQHP